MADESEEKERLNNSEFGELIPHLPLQDLLRVEYRTNKWYTMIQVKDPIKKIYGCSVCTVTQSGVKNLFAHVDGKKHKLKMEAVKQLFHPEYTYAKGQGKLAAAATSNDSTENEILKIQTTSKGTSKNSTSEIPMKEQKPVKIDTPVIETNTSVKTSNTKNFVLANSTPSKKINVDKTKNLNLQDKIDNMTINTEVQVLSKNHRNTKLASIKPVMEKPSDLAKNEILKSTTVVKTSKVSSKSDTPLDDNSRKLVKNPFALKSNGNNNDSQENQKPLKISCVPTFKLKEPSASENIESDIIIIDDDLTTDLNKVEISLEKNVTEKSSVSDKVKINIEPVKVNDNIIDSEEPLSKKQKIVVNPAAAFLEKAGEKHDEEMTNKPRYQSDIVIIPTVHKIKKVEPASSRQLAQPKFSTKTFSSKPSDNDVHGLIGVEYVVKILKSRQDESPRYECGLCELVLDGFAMQNHLVGYSHRLKFCEKHFPTAIRQYRQYINQVPQHETYKVLTPILAKLAVAIEQHHGRDLPYECLQRDFNINRNEVLSKVFSCRHASEQYGPTFTHVIDSKEIDEFIAHRNMFTPKTSAKNAVFDSRQSSGSSTLKHHRNSFLPPQREHQRHPDRQSIGDMSSYNIFSSFAVQPAQFITPYHHTQGGQSVVPIDDETHKLMVDDFLRGNNKQGLNRSRLPAEHYDRERRSKRSRSISPRSKDRNRNQYKSRSPISLRYDKKLPRKSISPLRNNDIWQAYRHLVDQKQNELNKLFKEYREDPETHPMYNEEWQKFWKRRKDELIAAGLDHRTYNYQPEWVRFVKVRIEELYSQEVENIKIQSRERLCLPLTNHELTDSKYHVQVDRSIDLQPTDNEMEVRITNQLPLKNTTTPGVVSVLRLMTALEECLGSLGPKIIDLLSKALQTEKINPDQVNSIILTVENCTLLETGMEKFKGLIMAGLLEGSKERALNKAIQEIESILILAEKERINNNTQSPVPVLSKSLRTNNSDLTATKVQHRHAPVISVPHKPAQKPSIVVTPKLSYSQKQNDQFVDQQQSGGALKAGAAASISSLLDQADKTELAAKLAAALTAQGRTDFDQQQLQKLISVYTLIEKKKREAAAVTTETEVVVSSNSTSGRKALSDTLADFLNPTAQSSGLSINTNPVPAANPTYSTQDINNYVDMMRRSQEARNVSRDSDSNTYTTDMNMWSNQQNVQQSSYNSSSNIMPMPSITTQTNNDFLNSSFGPNMYLNDNNNSSTAFGGVPGMAYRPGFNNNNITDQFSMNTLNASRNHINNSYNNRRVDSNNININLKNRVVDTFKVQGKQNQHHQQISQSNSFGRPNIHDLTRNSQQNRKSDGRGNQQETSNNCSNTYWRKN